MFEMSPTVSKATNNSIGLSGPFTAEIATGTFPAMTFRLEAERAGSGLPTPANQNGSLNWTVFGLSVDLDLPASVDGGQARIKNVISKLTPKCSKRRTRARIFTLLLTT